MDGTTSLIHECLLFLKQQPIVELLGVQSVEQTHEMAALLLLVAVVSPVDPKLVLDLTWRRFPAEAFSYSYRIGCCSW